MAFINRTDCESAMEPDEIDQIIDGNSTVLDDAIADAEELASEMLRPRFNLDIELAKTGTDRNRQLVKQMVAIAVFYISERLVSNVQPESRLEAFERAEKWLSEVSRGMRQTDLTSIDEEGQVGYRIKWGTGKVKQNNDY